MAYNLKYYLTLFVTSLSYRYFGIIFYYWYYFAETSTIGNGDYYSLVGKKVRPFSLVWFETSTVLKNHFSTVAIRKFQMDTKSANITVPLLLEQKKKYGETFLQGQWSRTFSGHELTTKII